MENWFTHKKLLVLAVGVGIVFNGLAFWGPAWLRLSGLGPNQPAASAAPQFGEPATTMPTHEPVLYQYVEVIEGCGPYFDGACVNLRSGPGVEYPAVAKLRTGMVLKVASTEVRDGREWHRISFDEGLRYPERVSGDMYVAASVVRLFTDEGVKEEASHGSASSGTKRIIVDRSEQVLYAYDGQELFMQEPISTGLEFTPTPRGIFTVYKKTPSRYMQGPLPGISDQYYDLPGVPWNLYFTYQGAVIHGAYWHDHFGEPWSHGCVNVTPKQAQRLYQWAEVGTHVTVRD